MYEEGDFVELIVTPCTRMEVGEKFYVTGVCIVDKVKNVNGWINYDYVTIPFDKVKKIPTKKSGKNTPETLQDLSNVLKAGRAKDISCYDMQNYLAAIANARKRLNYN